MQLCDLVEEEVGLAFVFEETEISGLMRIRPHMFSDDRGLYRKYYEREEFADHGIMCAFSESCDLVSRKGALRGLHYQLENPQAKLIHVISGSLYDVAIDLRRNSPTFGQYHAELLDGDSDIVLFVPAEFAHGFIALEDRTIFSYQCSGSYIPTACGGILWNDPALGIPWPIKENGIDRVIATEKDLHWPTMSECVHSARLF